MFRIILLWFAFSVNIKEAISGYENSLFAKLLNNYNVELRPVRHQHDQIQVQVDLGLTQIISMDEKHQVLIWNGWVKQYWNDHRLKWNTSQFGNIDDISVDKDIIWKPDMALYNNAKENFQLLSVEAQEKIIVTHSGNCFWAIPFVFRTICQLNVKYFPFDEQSCQFEIGSWAYTGDVFNISYKNPQGDLSQYSENSAWKVLKIDVAHKIGYYQCCPEPFPSIIYTMQLRRRSRHYIYKIFIPTLLIALLAIFSFFLPSSSGERVTLLSTNFVSLAFFIMSLSTLVPPTSEVTPLIEIYLTAVFIEICAALILRCFIDIFKRKQLQPGRFVRVVVNQFLATLLCVRRKTADCLTPENDNFPALGPENINLAVLKDSETYPDNSYYEWRDGTMLRRVNRLADHDNDSSIYMNNECHGENTKKTFSSEDMLENSSGKDKGMTEFEERSLFSLETVSDSVVQKYISKKRRQELDQLIQRVDQLFFWLFTLAMSGTLLFVFLTPPNLVF
ncbi:neuronal acetylcholine receptor subunit alpha-10-like [Rhopilema esculentum]|uniref:neuronal acetylcholine receptor subunit alpha-10-like n=1 Tax=Rhopilema esculentum TaxID=499914 RepID=UPI0031D5F41E